MNRLANETNIGINIGHEIDVDIRVDIDIAMIVCVCVFSRCMLPSIGVGPLCAMAPLYRCLLA